jgi:hypothetical protein
MMTTIGIIDESLEAQSNTNIKELEDFNLVFSYPNIYEFYKNEGKSTESKSPKIIIVDLEFIERDHLNKIKELLDFSKADFCIALYSFEKRDLIEKLETNFCKPVKKPMTLRLLKVYLSLSLKKLNNINKNKTSINESDSNLSENKEEVENKIKSIVKDLNSLEEYLNTLNNSNNTNEINYEHIKLEIIRSRLILENSLNKITT